MGELQTEADWKVEQTVVGKGASIGSNATILANIENRRECDRGRGQRRHKRCSRHTRLWREIRRRSCASFTKAEAEAMPDTVPFLDLIAPHLELEHELVGAFRQGLRTAAFVGGPVVEKFEEAFRRILRY